MGSQAIAGRDAVNAHAVAVVDRATVDARALAVLVATRLRGFRALDRGALDDVLASLDDPRRGSRRGARLEVWERRTLKVVEGLLRRVPGLPGTCLVRSLARFAAFARMGLDVRFVMALRPESGDVVGHAWLEIEGEPFEEVVDARLVETFAFPPRPLTHAPATP
jgi:hypothetical protein